MLNRIMLRVVHDFFVGSNGFLLYSWFQPKMAKSTGLEVVMVNVVVMAFFVGRNISY